MASTDTFMANVRKLIVEHPLVIDLRTTPRLVSLWPSLKHLFKYQFHLNKFANHTTDLIKVIWTRGCIPIYKNQKTQEL